MDKNMDNVNSQMGWCPNCSHPIDPGDAFCSSCGKPVVQALPQPQAVVAQTTHVAGAVVPLDLHQMMNAYDPHLDLNCISPAQREMLQRHSMFETFSVGGAIVLHFITLGIFTVIYMGLKHSTFPRVRPDDFGAGKAIGFLFIPIFNLYWIFVFWLRLADRINFQYRLRSLPSPISRGLVLATLIIGLIPFVRLISWLVVYPMVVAQVQGACNGLAIHLARSATIAMSARA